MKNSFRRGLSAKFIEALKGLAASEADNWWKEVLENESIILAVRDEYMNAYVKGQSVFKIEFDRISNGASKPRLSVHYKYLIKPELEESNPYIEFDGDRFSVDPA
jgi:hypothetical protein